MYRDKSLLPAQAVRLAVLGTLARGDVAYGVLAASSRRFMAALIGPNLDLFGTSIELLRIEGLIAVRAGDGDQAVMTLTPSGQALLQDLLAAPLRSPSTDMSRLVLALKLRFLDLLPEVLRRDQVALMVDAGEAELARLTDLAATEATDGALGGWLTLEADAIRARLAWLNTLS
jgi:hypothetical protein